MYSLQQSRPPATAGGPAPTASAQQPAAQNTTNRYMKGRLPEGVDFSSYPGRSSTPLPTAESKSAERINQLKIWNEAATNDDKRRLNAKKGGVSVSGSSSSTRRTDSFKDAKDRHSASFHAPPPSSTASSQSSPSVSNANTAYPPRNIRAPPPDPVASADMFADRSDSEDDEDDEDDDALLLDSDPAISAPAGAPDHLRHHAQHQLPHQQHQQQHYNPHANNLRDDPLDEDYSAQHHAATNSATTATLTSASVSGAPPPAHLHSPGEASREAPTDLHQMPQADSPEPAAPGSHSRAPQQKGPKGACCVIM